MLRKVVSKVAWVGRTASMVFGLALVLALMIGAASVALAGTGVGGVFNLGQTNTVNALTRLAGSVAGSSLVIDNNSTGTGATALDLQVEPGKPPMKVNRTTKVANLNADTVDGLDSTRLVEARGDVNGNAANFSGILEHSEGSSFLNTGFHTVVAHATKGTPVDVLLSCPSQTGAGTLRIVNNTPNFGDSQRVWVDDGSANPSFNTLGQNQSIDKTVSPSGDHFTIQVASIFNANRMATIELFTEQFGPSVCVAKSHVIYTFAP
jgi:hypothetical protein